MAWWLGHRHRRRWLLWMMLLAAGCATPEGMHVVSVPVVSRRLAALPAEGYRWHCEHHAVERPTVVGDPADTGTAKKNFDDSVDYRLMQHGGLALRGAALDGLPHAYPFHLWVHGTLRELLLRGYGRLQEGRAPPGDWRFSSSVGDWRAVLNADFIMVSLFNDGRDPGPFGGCRSAGGMVVGGGLGGAAVGALALIPAEKQAPVGMSSAPLPEAAIACVVHLETSRIVWCKVTPLNDDLMLRASAQYKVDTLLDELLRSGDGAPSEPPPAGPPLDTIGATPVKDPAPAPLPVKDPEPAPSPVPEESTVPLP